MLVRINKKELSSVQMKSPFDPRSFLAVLVLSLAILTSADHQSDCAGAKRFERSAATNIDSLVKGMLSNMSQVTRKV